MHSKVFLLCNMDNRFVFRRLAHVQRTTVQMPYRQQIRPQASLFSSLRSASRPQVHPITAPVYVTLQHALECCNQPRLSAQRSAARHATLRRMGLPISGLYDQALINVPCATHRTLHSSRFSPSHARGACACSHTIPAPLHARHGHSVRPAVVQHSESPVAHGGRLVVPWPLQTGHLCGVLITLLLCESLTNFIK